jgi:hypothetical protein
MIAVPGPSWEDGPTRQELAVHAAGALARP